jgi:hypothetical protein
VVKRKIPRPSRDSNPRSSRSYPSTKPLSYPSYHLTRMPICCCRCICTVVSIVMALRWTDLPTKESYQMSVDREVH